jgi:hypothetical protein
MCKFPRKLRVIMAFGGAFGPLGPSSMLGTSWEASWRAHERLKTGLTGGVLGGMSREPPSVLRPWALLAFVQGGSGRSWRDRVTRFQ